MKIKVHQGMINIDSESFSYTNLNGSGDGLQVIPEFEYYEDEITKLCRDISDNLYKLYNLTK